MQFDISAPLLPDLVSLHGKWYPDKPAIIDEHVTLTWSGIDRGSSQVANGLRALGIGRGDSVAILMGNIAEYVEIMFGIFKAGAVAVPLNITVSDADLLTMLHDAFARAVFFSPDQFDRLQNDLGRVDSLVQGGRFL